MYFLVLNDFGNKIIKNVIFYKVFIFRGEIIIGFKKKVWVNDNFSLLKKWIYNILFRCYFSKIWNSSFIISISIYI